ncbi:hypothetical protein G5V59_06860 [Nocardioides sp. W3-2-3]|uniref:hypothetical protein n=1 Tax=Nocardioides convexus TaxID=2712224 RepID=UPI002418B4A4|nr:hypothetical protein [Nocardioides convexus]NHA00026.1 hypothetical protein [Nocardioides convexus]
MTTVGGSALAVVPLLVPAYADVDAPAAAAALDLPAGVTVSATTGDPVTRAVADTAADADTRFNDFPSRGRLLPHALQRRCEQGLRGRPDLAG